jgi:hypothetical protein
MLKEQVEKLNLDIYSYDLPVGEQNSSPDISVESPEPKNEDNSIKKKKKKRKTKNMEEELSEE